MRLEVIRDKFGGESTLGKLYIDGEFECYTLEDQVRPNGEKVRAETAIPEGTYKITLRTEGGFHERYARRFPKIHKGMLWIRDVPGFEYILIHAGNTDDDTAGCILVGRAPKAVGKDDWSIIQSMWSYEIMYRKIIDRIASREPTSITIMNKG